MTRTVTVTGQGSARIVPDSAVVRVAAVHRAASVGQAFAAVASAVDGITSAARSVVDESRIGSRDLNVWATSDHQGRHDGFECRHALEIRCPTLDVAGSLLASLVDAVGNRLQVEGVNLEVTDDTAAQVEAREAAYADAVARATQLAGLAGARLGPVLAVSEGGAHPVPVREMAMAPMAMTDFQPGERSLGSTLSVTFELLEQQT